MPDRNGYVFPKSYSTFCLNTKGGAKKSRLHKNAADTVEQSCTEEAYYQPQVLCYSMTYEWLYNITAHLRCGHFVQHARDRHFYEAEWEREVVHKMAGCYN